MNRKKRIISFFGSWPIAFLVVYFFFPPIRGHDLSVIKSILLSLNILVAGAGGMYLFEKRENEK